MCFSVQAYLSRIGYQGNASPTLETLRALQFSHLCSVPYENLDIIAGIPLSLSEEALFDKIVTRRRGGYCFELNELYSRLLRALGFEVVDCFGRFLLGAPETIPMRRHHVLIVTIPGTNERYLSDVGVGVGSPNTPLLMEYNLEQRQGDTCFRLDFDAFFGWIVKFKKNDDWRALFCFTEEPQAPIDFVATSFYCERSPESIFNKEAMVAIRTPTGRYTLDGDTFKHFDGDDVTVWREETERARRQTLRRLFGIDLGDDPCQGV